MKATIKSVDIHKLGIRLNYSDDSWHTVDPSTAVEILWGVLKERIASEASQERFTKSPQCGCRRVANGHSACVDHCELMPVKTQPKCGKCYDTGWLHGCQDWSPRRLNRGTPYYSERCACRKASATSTSTKGKS